MLFALGAAWLRITIAISQVQLKFSITCLVPIFMGFVEGEKLRQKQLKLKLGLLLFLALSVASLLSANDLRTRRFAFKAILLFSFCFRCSMSRTPPTMALPARAGRPEYITN
jgi:hypothetical protein